MQRVRMLKYLLVIAAATLLAACSGAAQPAQQEEAAAPAAAAATGSEAAAPAGDLPEGAEAFPEPPPLEVGNVAPNRQPIDQIMTYKALPAYHEPEWVTKLVQDGQLPPVEERLPKEPQVLLASGMANGIGVYGDVWRDFSACPTAGWNNGAGVTSGWFGIEAMSWWDGALVQTGPLFRADQDVEPMPQLAKSWEWSADGKQLTMHLIEGAKWSDGEPFTSEDVIFTWEDLILDPQVVRFGPKGSGWEWDGVQAKLVALDDYTIQWTFPVAKPVEKFYQMDEGDFSISPAHILKPLHPKYNSKMDYQSFANALPPDALPQVTMGPWAAVVYKTGELVVMRRNPYYWKVDEAGNQLPYIDEAVFQKGPSGAGRGLCTIAGGCDHANLENPASEFVVAMQAAQKPDAQFTINWGPELLAFGMMLNQSENLGVTDDREKAVRELFREDKFRQALSHAMDRDGIAQSIMRGPFLRAWAGGLYPGSPEFDAASVVYYPYNVDRAKALLAELGFKDTDGNGILNWPAGNAWNGEDLVLSLNTVVDAQETVNTGESLVPMLAQVGIKINLHPITNQVMNDGLVTGDWEMQILRGGQEFALPFTRCANLAPSTKETPSWNREGDQPRVLRDWEQQLVDITANYCVERDLDKRQELISEYNHIFTLHNYNLGIFVGRYGLALAKRFENVPTGTPVFLYDWVENGIMSEQVWTPVDQQLPEVLPDTIPVYNKSVSALPSN